MEQKKVKKFTKTTKKEFTNKRKKPNTQVRKRKPRMRDATEFTKESAPGFIESFINLDGYAVTVFKSPIREDRLPAYYKKYKNNKYALISFEDLDKISAYINSTKCKDNRKKDLMSIIRAIRNPSLRAFYKCYCNTDSKYKKPDKDNTDEITEMNSGNCEHENLMIAHAIKYKEMLDRRNIVIPEEFTKYTKPDVAEKFIIWAYDEIKKFNIKENN